MTSTSFLTRLLVVAAAFAAGVANAAPTVDTVTVQAYMKHANETEVLSTSANLVVGVFQAGTTNAIWAKRYPSVGINKGIFEVDLKGAGTDLSSGGPPAGTNMVADYGTITFNPSYLNSKTGETTVRVYVESSVDGGTPGLQFDIPVGASPTAFVADTANNVAAGSVLFAGIGTTAWTVTGFGGAAPSRLVATDSASGILNINVIPNIPYAMITGGPTNTGSTFSGNNSFTGDNTFTGNITASGTSTFSGPSTFSGAGTSLAVTNDETVGGNVTVTGGVSAATAGLGVLAVSGTSAFAGNTIFNGVITANGPGWALNVSNSESVNGNFVTVGTSAFGGASTFGSTVGITGNTTVGGTLGVTGNTTLGGTLGVTGASTLASLGVTGLATAGSLVSSGTSAFMGASYVGGTLNVNGLITGAGSPNAFTTTNVVQAGGFTSTGLTTTNTLTASGTSNFAGNVSSSGNLSNTGTASLATLVAAGTSAFLGNSFYANNLTVAGTTSLASLSATNFSTSGTLSTANLVTTGTSAFLGNLISNGTSTFNGLNVNGGATTLAGNLSVTTAGTTSLNVLAVAGTTSMKSVAIVGTTTFSGPIVATSVGTSGQVLTWASATAAPTWSSINQAPSKSNILLYEDFISGLTPAITAALGTNVGTATLVTGIHTAGATSYINTVANRAGVFRTATGTAAGVKNFLGFCSATAAGVQNMSMRFEATDVWTFEAAVAVGSNAAGSGSLWIGLMSAAPAALTTQAAVPGVFFEGLSAVGLGTMTPISRGASTNTGLGPVSPLFPSATTFHDFKITSDGTTINFFVDGVNKGSTATATAIPSTTALCPGIYHFSTATGLNIDTDYVLWTQTNGR